MPVYRYRNLTTNETFDFEQRIIEPALTHHPETGDPVKRLIQPVGIAFKGSGFYVTDSRSSNGSAKPSDKSGDKPGDKPEKAAKPEGTAKPDAPAKSEGSKTAVKSGAS